MKIEDILKLPTIQEKITELKNGRASEPVDVEVALKALDISKHDVNNPAIRKDKKVHYDAMENGKKVTKTKREEVNRLAFGFQSLIINRTVSFTFGNPINLIATPENENEKGIFFAITKILREAKETSLNREIGDCVFGFKEVAEVWYPVEQPNEKYGFKSNFKLRNAIYSPMYGDKLYPYFDETKDLTAFSREFTITEGKKKYPCFETYTNTQHFFWIKREGNWETYLDYPKPIEIGIIPVVYGYQSKFETEDINKLISRLEFLLSNFADTNDYHASPKIFVVGRINGVADKGDSSTILEGEKDSSAQYLSWDNAPESVKLEISTLIDFMYTLTQTPDISFSSVKGINGIATETLKLLFMDAHLKVQDKRKIFDKYFQRRINVLKKFVGKFNSVWEADADNFDIEPEIIPYMLDSEYDRVKTLLLANGNRPILSQESSVSQSGLTNNPEKELETIKREELELRQSEYNEPTL